jgi:NtrC-family two-component system sensor histidine kinase KinB
MGDYLILFLAFIALAAIAWSLRRQPLLVLQRGQEYRAVLDTLEDAILVFSLDGQPVYMNPVARQWFRIDEAERYDTRPLRVQISPLDDFLALRAHGGRAALRIGPRHVEAVAQQIEIQGVTQITITLHDVTAAQALLDEERRRVRELAVFNDINQVINSASLQLNELLDSILDKLGELFSYTSAAISLWEAEQEQLVVKGCVGPMAQVNDVLPGDVGYAAYIVQNRRALFLSDTAQRPDLDESPSMRSYVGVPLLAGDDLIGTLELASDQVNVFSKETLDTLRVVASQAAVAIGNARLYTETLVRADELATLNTLSAVTTASLNFDELLEIIVYSIQHVIGCDRSAIFVMDSERGVLNLAKGLGLSEEYIFNSRNLKPEPGSRMQVALDRYPLLVSDVRETPELADFMPMIEQEGYAAFADFPLRGREHVLGTLTVYYDEPHAFDESELELLTTFANQVALALENARLYERTDRALARRVVQLAALEEIGRQLTSTLDLAHVFDRVLQHAMSSTGASAGLLVLCDLDNDRLELITHQGYPEGALAPYEKEGWPQNQGIMGRVVRTGEAALVSDVHADPDHVSHVPTTHSQLTVPILKENRVLGAISLESDWAQGFGSEDERFTTQLAELAAIAIDNARLFQQVREGRDNLQAVLDSTREGILVIDRNKRIVLANPIVEEMSGLAAQELVGRRISTVVTALEQRGVALLGHSGGETKDILHSLTTMSDQVTRHTYEAPGPPAYYVEQITSPVVDKDDVVVGRLAVFRDITEERRLAQMRQDLTDMIVHDLRSPLTAVIGGLQVAGDLLDAQADPTMIHRALEMSDESCNRLMVLVNSLLDISRLEAGQMPLELGPVLLPQLAQAVVQQMEPVAEHQMVALQLRASQVPPVEADSELVSRVLVNLVDNALKHSFADSTVTIEIAPEPVEGGARRPTTSDAEAPQRCVRCTVLDMGPGIPNEHREKIFERFAQLDGRRRGAGLGLAFCRLTIQAHGGRIWVEDNPEGQGSAFAFTLPVLPLEVLSRLNPDLAEQSTFESWYDIQE